MTAQAPVGRPNLGVGVLYKLPNHARSAHRSRLRHIGWTVIGGECDDEIRLRDGGAVTRYRKLLTGHKAGPTLGALVLLTLRVAAIGDVRSLVDLAALTFYFSVFSAGRSISSDFSAQHSPLG